MNIGKVCCLIMVSFFYFHCTLTHANCSAPNGPTTYTFTLSNMILTVPSDATLGPIGDVIDVPAGPHTNMSCNAGPNTYNLKFTSAQTPSVIKDVYETNVPGIGIKIWDDFQNPEVVVGNSLTYWYDGTNLSSSWSGASWITNIKAQFYVTGPVTPGNVVLSTPLVEDWLIQSNSTLISQLTIGGTVAVHSSTCDVDEASTPKTVNLQPINTSVLPAKGDTGGKVDFKISLECSGPATTINLTLTDPNGGDQQNGVLYNDTGKGMAENVGVQLLAARNGIPIPQTVPLNQSFLVGQSGPGHYDIAMAARYYRTSEAAVTGGKVSASVIYELSYQ